MELALIRHTRCDIAAGVCYGQLDIPLASTASADIEQTLSQVPPLEVVFASPSQRCQLLAQALARRDRCELRTRPDLRELDFGDWEGCRWSDIPRARSDAWAADTWGVAPPQGECESQLWHRVSRVAEELLELNDSRQRDGEVAKRVGVVSHGGPLRHLRCLLTGMAPSERWGWSPQLGEVTLISHSATTITGPRESACPSSGL